MSDADIEEITSKIAQLGETVKQAKADKKPKEEWEPALQEMLALKVCRLL
jgi:WHEP-TRS domain